MQLVRGTTRFKFLGKPRECFAAPRALVNLPASACSFPWSLRLRASALCSSVASGDSSVGDCSSAEKALADTLRLLLAGKTNCMLLFQQRTDGASATLRGGAAHCALLSRFSQNFRVSELRKLPRHCPYPATSAPRLASLRQWQQRKHDVSAAAAEARSASAAGGRGGWAGHLEHLQHRQPVPKRRSM